jgi:hypothetical protein
MELLTRQAAITAGHKTCRGALCSKHPELDGARRVSGACVECALENTRRRRAALGDTYKQYAKENNGASWKRILEDPERHQQRRIKAAEYRVRNKERVRASIAAWSSRNPEKLRAYSKTTKRRNPGAVNDSTAKRRAARLQRTPAWLSEDEAWMISQAYELAALRAKLFGFPWHVDHVIPLQGKLVSGLHTPYNLQVIPGAENLRKHCKFSA